ncbi:hypothetical protein BDY24DRAFT_70664 [Mrakia frigida]|uniref:uncharacterized protein n=1 Tax=Mrakia frigida TaxID=29902 RepID=UPI003FCBF0B1
MADVYKVDQTSKVVAKAVKDQQSSTWSLPTWVWVVLIVCVGFWGRKAWNEIALKNKMGRYKMEKRRRHGIPDSDDRPFKIALLDVVAKQQVQDKARAEENAKLQVEESREWTRWGDDAGVRERKGINKSSLSHAPQQRTTPSSPPEMILSPYNRNSQLPSPPPFSFGRHGSVASSHDGGRGSERMTGGKSYEFGSGTVVQPSLSSTNSRRTSGSRPQANSNSSHTLSSSSQRRPSSTTNTAARPPASSSSRRSSNNTKPSGAAGKKRVYVEDSDEDEMEEEIEMEEVGRGRDGGKRRRRAERERDEQMDVSEEEEGSARSDEMDHEDEDDSSSKVSLLFLFSFPSNIACRREAQLPSPLRSLLSPSPLGAPDEPPSPPTSPTPPNRPTEPTMTSTTTP